MGEWVSGLVDGYVGGLHVDRWMRRWVGVQMGEWVGGLVGGWVGGVDGLVFCVCFVSSGM